MDAHQIGLMATYALPAHFDAGEMIFRKGELEDCVLKAGGQVLEGGFERVFHEYGEC